MGFYCTFNKFHAFQYFLTNILKQKKITNKRFVCCNKMGFVIAKGKCSQWTII